MITKLKDILHDIYDVFATRCMHWFSTKRLILGKNVRFIGFPHYIIHREATIKIGDNCTIGSSNRRYHANMYSKTKLFADKAGSSIVIGDNSRLQGACVHAYSSVTIGKNCLIAANTQVLDSNGHAPCYDNPADRLHTADKGRPIVIEDNVWVGINSIVLGGTHIGEGSIIAANSVVKGDVPSRCIYGGNPAKLIKQF